MPKIVCLMPIHERKKLTIATIRQLQKQTIPIEIILIGSWDDDREVAEIVGVPYFEHPNQPLGAKLQFGVDVIRKLNPDYLLLCGSDDWLSANWCEFLIPKFKPDIGLVGALTYYIADCVPDKPVQISWREAYKGTGRFGEPIGQGRLLDCKFLEMLDWKLFPVNQYAGMDWYSFNKIKSTGARCYGYKGDEVACLVIKGNWPCITSLKKYKRIPIEENQNIIIEKFFPGRDILLEKLCQISE
jgi:glycosyltransferase involved in cell wall biosynthesis